MKLRMNIVAMATGIVLGSILMFPNEAQAKTHLRYDIPQSTPLDTYFDGLGHLICFNTYGQAVISDEYTTSTYIVVWNGYDDTDNPYSDEEMACQQYVATERHLMAEYPEDCNVANIESLMDMGSFSDDIMDDLFRNTNTERSKAFKTYIALAEQGYTINDIYVLMGPCNFSEEVMSRLFYSVLNQAQ